MYSAKLIVRYESSKEGYLHTSYDRETLGEALACWARMDVISLTPDENNRNCIVVRDSTMSFQHMYWILELPTTLAADIVMRIWNEEKSR